MDPNATVEVPNRGNDETADGTLPVPNPQQVLPAQDGGNNENATTAEEQEEVEDGGEDEPAVKKACFSLAHVPCEADKWKWELPEELAEFFDINARKHIITDKDMLVYGGLSSSIQPPLCAASGRICKKITKG